ncbi:unnamed protein product, partial [marine sediment metagenome]
NEKQQLETYDNGVIDVHKSALISGNISTPGSIITVYNAIGAAFGSASIFIYNVTGTVSIVKLSHALPGDAYETIYSQGGIVADYKLYQDFDMPSSSIQFVINVSTPGACDYYIELHRLFDAQSYRP